MFKRNQEEEHENHERWMVSYADFVTLLFAFFTVMYATSQKDVEKEKKFESSIKKAFAVLFVQPSESSTPKLGDEFTIDHANTIIAPPIEVFRRTQVGSAELEQALQKTMAVEDTSVQVKHDAIGARISLASQAFFQEGSAELNEEAFPILNKIGATLVLTQQKIVIEGHTDNQKISTKNYPSNWELAAARAARIVRYLASQHQIAPERMVAVSYGEQKPVSTNATAEGRAQNRRIEILLVTDEKKSF